MGHRENILEYVESNGGVESVTGTEVAEAVGCTTDTVYRHWHDAESTDTEPEPDTEPDAGEVDDPDDEPAEVDAGDVVEQDDDPDDDPDDHAEPFEDEDTEVDGDPDAGELDDDLADDDGGKEYNCGNCGREVDYLGGDDRDGGGKECPGCGERLLWSQVPS